MAISRSEAEEYARRLAQYQVEQQAANQQLPGSNPTPPPSQFALPQGYEEEPPLKMDATPTPPTDDYTKFIQHSYDNELPMLPHHIPIVNQAVSRPSSESPLIVPPASFKGLGMPATVPPQLPAPAPPHAPLQTGSQHQPRLLSTFAVDLSALSHPVTHLQLAPPSPQYFGGDTTTCNCALKISRIHTKLRLSDFGTYYDKRDNQRITGHVDIEANYFAKYLFVKGWKADVSLYLLGVYMNSWQQKTDKHPRGWTWEYEYVKFNALISEDTTWESVDIKCLWQGTWGKGLKRAISDMTSTDDWHKDGLTALSRNRKAREDKGEEVNRKSDRTDFAVIFGGKITLAVRVTLTALDNEDCNDTWEVFHSIDVPPIGPMPGMAIKEDFKAQIRTPEDLY